MGRYLNSQTRRDTVLWQAQLNNWMILLLDGEV
jgi:hypothetical protein